jgi:hypothetical protein
MDTTTYIATKKDVEQLMLDRLRADSVLGTTRNTYLRMLLATAQKRLGLSVVRAPRSAIAATDDVLLSHAQMVESVHSEFYEVIKAVAAKTPKDPDDIRDIETVMASRLVFARSAYATIRAWILRGRHSLASIVAAKAIKREMAELTPAREARPGAVRPLNSAPLVRSAEAILAKIVAAGASDKESAILALQDVINHLIHGFDELGMSSALIKDAVDHTATDVLTPGHVPIAAAPAPVMRRRRAA